MKPPDGRTPKVPDKLAARRRREAEALRENLKRRKAQTRARAARSGTAPGKGGNEDR